jgi:hypothetical protein
VRIGANYLALKVFLGEPLGANDLQICVVLPYYLDTCEYMYVSQLCISCLRV